MKKYLFRLSFLLLLAAAFLAWEFLGPGTAFTGKSHYLYVSTGSNYTDVKAMMEKDSILAHPRLFDLLARRMDYPKKIKAGKFNIPAGISILNLVRMLRNGRQEPVNLVITKLRTREDLCGLIGRKFECDSAAFAAFLNNPDTLRHYGLDTNTVMTRVLPDTYSYFWNITPTKVFSKFQARYDGFWTPERKAQAKNQGLDPLQVYIIASIVEEETNFNPDKGKIASVYLNRLKCGMKLSADPTVKFAMRDFGLRRIYNKYLSFPSPYNTYEVKGLPPGPICTPSTGTIDSVLTAPKTPYLYFVAKSDFSGASVFAATYEDHLKNAKAYQEALDKEMQQKKNQKDSSAH
jgi:UPF0755 protein